MMPASTTEAVMTPSIAPRRLTLDDPAPLLRWLASNPAAVDLGQFEVAEIWGLTALSVPARKDGPEPIRVHDDPSHQTARFARAVGFFDVVAGRPSQLRGEEGKTVKLTRVTSTTAIEPIADQISKLLVASELEDTRKTIYYVLVELLRNVLQHSRDPLGGVVAAQRHSGGRSLNRPVIQVAVGDAGIGIYESLKASHPSLNAPREALEKALWPHFSGTFTEGETGSAQNAGMGLFFITEMTKLVAGTLLLASRDAALLLEGDPTFEAPDSHRLRFLAAGLGYPGTLVAFEMPADEEQDYDAMIETIRERARERTPRRAVHKWLRFEQPPPAAQLFVVKIAAEDTTHASRLGEHLSKLLFEHHPIALDFQGLSVCTQSFVHALLFQALRLAWAVKCPVYVINAQPAVRSTLELLENYALGG